MSPKTAPKLNVLIFDDDPPTARRLEGAVRRALELYNEPCLAQHACTYERADQLVTGLIDQQRIYVLVDINLVTGWEIKGVQWDGWDVLKWLKEKLPKAKVVLYSAQQAPGDIDRALQYGAYDLVSVDNIDDAEKGIIGVLAGFAAIEQRLQAARNASQDHPDPGIDPLAHLLLKVNIGILIVSRHGHVWFQNDYNKEVNRCGLPEGRLCHKVFHNWIHRVGRCPWCPTLEAIDARKSRKRVLLLPVKQPDNRYALECVDMATEPLWSLGEEGKPDPTAAGAIESNLLRTTEWKQKEPIQRIVDLLVMTAGVLSERLRGLRLTVYEVAESQLACRPVATCLVSAANETPPLLRNVSLEVWNSTPDWSGQIRRPGPAADVSLRSDRDDGELKDINYYLDGGHERPRERLAFDTAPIVGLRPALPGETLPRYQYLQIRTGDPRPVMIVEIGYDRVSDPYGNPPEAQDVRKPIDELVKHDLLLYLDALEEAVSEGRDRRATKLGAKCPPTPQLGECKNEEQLWKCVQDAVVALAASIDIGTDDLWWHYRGFVENVDFTGRHSFFLRLSEAATDQSNSPYALMARQVCPSVQVPPSGEWPGHADDFEPDPRAVEGLRHRSSTSMSGSYLCRVSGQARLMHVEPSLGGESNYKAVLNHAKAHDRDRYAKLCAIRSYGDFPVGDRFSPLGTFHVQSTHKDLFAAREVRDFFLELAEQISLALSRILAEEYRRKIRDLRTRGGWRRFIGEALSARCAEVEAKMSRLPVLVQGTDNDKAVAVSSLSRLQSRLTALRYLAAMQSLPTPYPLDGPGPATECDLLVIGKEALEMTRTHVMNSPDFKDVIPVSIGASANAIPLTAHQHLLRSALLELFEWVLQVVSTDAGSKIGIAVDRNPMTGDPLIEVAFQLGNPAEIDQAYFSLCTAEPTPERLLDAMDHATKTLSRETVIHFALVRLLLARSLPQNAVIWGITLKADGVILKIAVTAKAERGA